MNTEENKLTFEDLKGFVFESCAVCSRTSEGNLKRLYCVTRICEYSAATHYEVKININDDISIKRFCDLSEALEYYNAR